METPVQLAQDISFINRFRKTASDLIVLIDTMQGLGKEYADIYSNSGRLTSEAFVSENEGLVKDPNFINAKSSFDAVLAVFSNNNYRLALDVVENPQ